MYKNGYIVPSLALLCIIVLLITGPIPQDQNYHNFADRRPFLGIPNFLNVITNLPFLLVGVKGLREAGNLKEKYVKPMFSTIFFAFVLLTFGSGYYHWFPQNITLVYDRVPMTVIFMTFFSFIIYEYIGQRKGYTAFIILNIIGILTVLYWILTEQRGSGDLRWYGMIQFFPIIAIPLIMVLYKQAGNHWKAIIPIFIFFALAKLAEQFDKQIYFLLHQIISGHSLKHLFVAVAEYEIVVMTRRIAEDRNKYNLSCRRSS